MTEQPSVDAREDTSEASRRPWYTRPQAVLGLTLLVAPIALAFYLIADALDQGPDLTTEDAPPTFEPFRVDPEEGEAAGDPAPEAEDDVPAEDGPGPATDDPPPEPAEPDPEPPADPEAPETDSEPALRVPDRGPEPEPQTISGTGTDHSQGVRHRGGLAVFTISHEGEEDFSVAVEGIGRRERLARAEGNYGGSRAVDLEPGGYRVEVVADGDWEVTLTQPRHTDGEPIPAQFRGRSDTATAPFRVGDGDVRIRMRAARPDERFRVVLFSADGSERRQLLDTEGPADERQTGRLGRGIYLLDVQGRGEWAVDVGPG